MGKEKNFLTNCTGISTRNKMNFNLTFYHIILVLEKWYVCKEVKVDDPIKMNFLLSLNVSKEKIISGVTALAQMGRRKADLVLFVKRRQCKTCKAKSLGFGHTFECHDHTIVSQRVIFLSATVPESTQFLQSPGGKKNAQF